MALTQVDPFLNDVVPQVLLTYSNIMNYSEQSLGVEVGNRGRVYRRDGKVEAIRDISSIDCFLRTSESIFLKLLRAELSLTDAILSRELEVSFGGDTIDLNDRSQILSALVFGSLFDPEHIESALATRTADTDSLPDDIRIFSLGNDYSGFFGTVSWCVNILADGFLKGYRPYFIFSGGLYLDPSRLENSWFDRFFVHKNFSDSEEELIRLSGRAVRVKYGYTYAPPHSLSFKEATDLFSNSISVKAEYLSLADSWSRANFVGPTLGVHYRGTDKVAEGIISEAQRVKYSKMFTAIRKIIVNDEYTSLFVATDELSFRHALEKEFRGDISVIFYSTLLSGDGLPVHFDSRIDPELKGAEALIDCLLLSRCDFVLKTPSLLSGFAKVFNPSLPIYFLEAPHENSTYFPETFIKLLPKE